MTKKILLLTLIYTLSALNAAEETPLTALPKLPRIPKLQGLALKAAVVPKNGHEADTRAIELNNRTYANR